MPKLVLLWTDAAMWAMANVGGFIESRWWARLSQRALLASVLVGAFGGGIAAVVPGRLTICVWSPELGVVQLRESASTLRFGSLWSGLSFPVAGDFDGSGRDEVRLFVASTNTLYRLEGDAPVAVEAFGPRGYLLPLAGRFTNSTKEPHGFAWPTGTPASQGIDAGALEALARRDLVVLAALGDAQRAERVGEQAAMAHATSAWG